MTSSPVMGAGIPFGNNLIPGTLNTTKTDFSEFKNLMGQAQRKINDLSNDLHGNGMKDDSVKTVNKEVRTDDRVSKIKQVKVEDSSKVSATDEEASEVTKAIDEIKEVLKEEFNVTDEEIETVLASLGLNQMALLDTQMIPKIVTEITGIEDAVSLVTDENLYESLSNTVNTVEQKVEALSNELNIPAEEIEETLKQFETVKHEDDFSFSNFLPEAEDTVSEDDTTKEPIESKIYVVGNNSARKEVSFETKIESIETKTTEEPKIENDLRKSGDFEQNSSNQNTPMTFAENLFSKVAESLNEQSGQVSFTSFDARNIMNQITDFIKVDLSLDNPEVSLRLHPETLGTVSVKISSNNEGLLTAQFIAQNESVKAVIESQAMVLRENLESKGVTVEAVEVLVESHAFERNLSDQRQGGETNNNNGFAKRTRRITLMEGVEDEVPEEDTLTKEMMIQNGNTVDYSV